MNLKPFLMISLALCSGQAARADPIHAVADGAFWHHDSGWIFPQKIGDFALVGIPQDVAGSRDAVAYYARVEGSARSTVSVEICAPDSALESDVPMTGRLASEDAFAVGKALALQGTRSVYAIAEGASIRFGGLYVVSSGEWRVRIRFAGSPVDNVQTMDAFALGQRWETLAAP